MTLNYGIFDSADPASPDRTYTATLLSRILSKYLSNGVVSGDLNELKVSVTDPPAMTVVVATGTAIVQGRFIENDAALTLNVSAAHATYPRIDRVVVRLSAVTARTVDIAVKAGTAASSPVAPELTQTTDVYEIPLAQIAVGAGVTSILTANITDQRVMPDITNLFRHDVEMGSSLNIEHGLSSAGLDVYGDSVMYGDLEVSGSLSAPSGTFTGNFVGPLTGDISGCIKRKITYSASSDDIVLIKGDQDVSLDRYITTTPIHHSLILPSGGSTNAGSIVIGTIGEYYSGPGTCTITCYDGSGTVVYTHTITSVSYINQQGGYWTNYTATIPQNTTRIVITGSMHWRWEDVYVIPSII